MYVEEKDRSWCSSNAANDNRAVTIEVASDTTDPYAITDEAYDALVRLCADIASVMGRKSSCGSPTRRKPWLISRRRKRW